VNERRQRIPDTATLSNKNDQTGRHLQLELALSMQLLRSKLERQNDHGQRCRGQLQRRRAIRHVSQCITPDHAVLDRALAARELLAQKMDEFERIAYLRARFEPRPELRTALLVGIGDDAAVLGRPQGNLAVSVDAAVQGVHFRPEFGDWACLGGRALVAALSDLAAMGAQPRAAVMALIVTLTLEDAAFVELIRGYAEAADEYRCPVIGGNLSRGTELSITTTVMGELEGTGLTRAGARPGHEIYVTGTLGAAALGLHLLEARTPERGRPFVERWRKPVARIDEGQSIARYASAAIDVSDGALQDLGHICEASGVGAQVDSVAIPMAPGFADLARGLGCDPLELALTGGEDYELIYTLPGGSSPGPGTRIGRITERSAGIVVRDAKGQSVRLPGHGYQHFQA
jgi:thiamine-monophosphate kinase